MAEVTNYIDKVQVDGVNQDLISRPLSADIAPEFSAATAYTAGQMVMHGGQLYRFTTNHAAGAWQASDVSAVSVGSELSALKDDLNDIVTSDIMGKLIVQGDEIALDHKGVCVYTSDDTADVTSFVTMSEYDCAVIPCEESDVFLVATRGQNRPRAWAFVSENGNVLSRADANVNYTKPVSIIAPEDSSYLVVNNYKSESIGKVFAGAYVNESVKSNADAIATIGEDVEDLKVAVYGGPKTKLTPLNTYTGWTIASNGSTYKTTGINLVVYKIDTNKTYTIERSNNSNASIGLSNSLFDGQSTFYMERIAYDSNPATYNNQSYMYLYTAVVPGTFTVDVYTSGSGKIAETKLDFSRLNAIASSKQMIDIDWTPIMPIPVTNSNGYIPAGTKCHGLPYSSTRSVCKYIGQHLSIYTFMSALQNPRSVLYTRRIKYGTLGKTYYGVTCFTLTSFSAGSQLGKFDNEIMRMKDGSNVEISPYEIEPGDTLQLTMDYDEVNPDTYRHDILILDVIKDDYGRISGVITAEATPPYVKTNTQISFATFLNNFVYGGYKYKVYRKTNRLDYGSYVPNNYVKGYDDEELESITYPDIMPEYGDKACVEEGTSVTINVINAKTYTSIKIYKNGTLIDTKTSITDFTMEEMTYGTYKFVLTDGTNNSETSLIVANINGSYDYDTKRVTFSSSNATPVFVASYITSGSYKGVQNLVKIFTDAERNQGWADVSEIVGERANAVQIGFLTDYGVAMWWSDKLTDEWEYWSHN